MKKIWIINQYICTPELNGDGSRHSFLAEQFIKKGYDVTLITSSFSHVPYREEKFKGFYKITNGSIRTLIIKGNKYKDNHGVSRVFSWLIFCFLLFFIPLKKIPKPDIIIVSSHSLLPILNTVFYFKKRFKKVKFILEIRDIWPLTLIELGGFSPKNFMIILLAYVEKLGYKKADYIVSLLKDTDKHIKSVLKNRSFKYLWISNGYQLQKDDYYQPLDESKLVKIPKNKFIVGYAGSLGKANAMEFIIESFKKIIDPDIYLCLLGTGGEIENLKRLALNCENIIFLDKAPKNQVHSFLQKCDLLYLGIRDLNLYRFGISMNKTFDYMYAEKPILISTRAENTVVELGQCGVVIPAEDIQALEDKILWFKGLSNKELNQMGNNGYSHLVEHYTYEKLALKYMNVFEEV